MRDDAQQRVVAQRRHDQQQSEQAPQGEGADPQEEHNATEARNSARCESAPPQRRPTPRARSMSARERPRESEGQRDESFARVRRSKFDSEGMICSNHIRQFYRYCGCA